MVSVHQSDTYCDVDLSRVHHLGSGDGNGKEMVPLLCTWYMQGLILLISLLISSAIMSLTPTACLMARTKL